MAAARETKAKETTGRKRQDEVKARQSLAFPPRFPQLVSSLNAIRFLLQTRRQSR